MATNYNIEMKRFNGTDDDTLYPVPANHADSHKTGGSDALTATDIGASKVAKVGTVVLPANNWFGVYDSSPSHDLEYYYHYVTIPVPTGWDSYKVDLQPSVAIIKQMIADKVTTIYTSGRLICAYPNYPTTDITLQYTITEVVE